MIGMYDEPVAVPIVDLLDSSMMKMYIDAAKGEYERAYNELKEFAKEFGDLYSPSDALNKAYFDATKGRMNSAINYLYLNGMDPLRSQEGRAYIAKIIRETPYSLLANWKSDAENMKIYNKAAASLMAEGKYDKDYANWMLELQGLSAMDKFNPYGDTRWTALSPAEYKSIDQLTKSYGDAIKPGLLTKQDVEGLGHTYDPKNDYLGISYSLIDNAASKAVQALKSTPQGQFEMLRIKSQMLAQGLYPTDAGVDKAFADRIAQSFGPKAGIQAMDANKYEYANYLNNLADQLDAKKSARDFNDYITRLKYNKSYETIFDIARENPGQTTSTDINNLKANGVALADPSGTWDEITSSQSQKDGNGNTLSENRKIQRITITDGATVVKSGGFKLFNEGRRKNITTGVYRKPGRKIEAEVSSGPVYNKKLNRYYIKATITAVNNNFNSGAVGQSIWVEVKPGYIGKAPNNAN